MCLIMFSTNLLQNEWVICRVFQKSPGGKKTHIQGLVKLGSFGNNTMINPSSVLPPLMDSSPYNSETRTTTVNENSHVTCFSDPMEDQKTQEEMIDSFNNSLLASSSSSNPHSEISPASILLSKSTVSNSQAQLYTNQILPTIANLQYPDSFLMQDQSILKMLLDNHGPNMKRNSKAEFSQDSVVSNHELIQRPFDDQEAPSSSAGPVDLDCLWSY